MIPALVISLLVAFLWLHSFRKMDKYEKEPERLIYLTFFAGVLATIPTLFLEALFRVTNHPQPAPLWNYLLYFLWVGLVEESFKLLAVRLTVYRSKEFNEVMDGMVYMTSAALGFAATENVGYMLGFGFSVWFLRAILSYLGHVSFSAILGYYLGKAKAESRGHWLWPGFLLAVSLHWLYDFFFVVGSIKKSGGFVLLGLAVWVVGLILTFLLIKKAQAVSPFRTTHVLPRRLTRSCQACEKTVPAKALVCHHCGTPLMPEKEITPKA